MHILYRITNVVNNKKYIGQSNNVSKIGALNPNFGRTASEETLKKRSLAYVDKRHTNYGKPSPNRKQVTPEQLATILSSPLSDRKLSKLLNIPRGVIRRILKGIY